MDHPAAIRNSNVPDHFGALFGGVPNDLCSRVYDSIGLQ